MNALQKVMKHYELTEWEDERDDALAIFTAAKEKLAALEAVAEAAREWVESEEVKLYAEGIALVDALAALDGVK